MVDWSNPEEVKEYYKNYREAHKEERKAYDKKYRATHKEEKKVYNREYNAKYIVTKYYKYIGVVICPKCKCKGHKKYSRKYNKKTGNYGKISTRILHRHTKNGKTVHDGVCFIGMGEL